MSISPSAVEGAEGPRQVTANSPGGIRPQRCSCRRSYLISSRNVPRGGGGNLQEADSREILQFVFFYRKGHSAQLGMCTGISVIAPAKAWGASNPPLCPEQKNWDRQKLENNWALLHRVYRLWDDRVQDLGAPKIT